VLFAYALLRSGTWRLPLGLHWGGNWVQMQVLDLGQLPAQSSAVWAMPLTATAGAMDRSRRTWCNICPIWSPLRWSCFVVRWVTQVREET
jgi:hypothetical protein